MQVDLGYPAVPLVEQLHVGAEGAVHAGGCLNHH